MIQIDTEEQIVKILSIWVGDIPEGTEEVVKPYMKYKDRHTSLNEDLYSCIVLEDLAEDEVVLSTEIKDALWEIKQLCDQYDCSYWRVQKV